MEEGSLHCNTDTKEAWVVYNDHWHYLGVVDLGISHNPDDYAECCSKCLPLKKEIK